ncbi:hypothetical protein INT43_003931, partial [Umbelopsis isabellina]
MPQTSSIHSSYSLSDQHWPRESSAYKEQDEHEPYVRIENLPLDHQRLDRAKGVSDKENGLLLDRGTSYRSRSSSKSEGSNYTRATSSSRSRAAATAAEKASLTLSTRNRMSSRDTRQSIVLSSDYDVGSESSDTGSPTLPRQVSVRNRRQSRTQFNDKERELLLKSSSLQTRRVSDAQAASPRMYPRQASTSILNKRKSAIGEQFSDHINDISNDKKYSTISSSGDTYGKSRNRLSRLFDEDNDNSIASYTLPRKSSLRTSRNFSESSQRKSLVIDDERLDTEKPLENVSSGASKSRELLETEAGHSKEARVTRKISNGRMRPKSRTLKSPPPPLNFDGPPNMPNLNQKYALFSPSRSQLSERVSSLPSDKEQVAHETSSANRIKRHQSLGSGSQNHHPPRISSRRHLQSMVDQGNKAVTQEKANEEFMNKARKSLPASFRSRSRATSVSEKNLDILVGELGVSHHTDGSNQTSKKEIRKSSGSLKRASSRISISEYHGYARPSSTHQHHRSISSSPPPSRSSSAFGENDDCNGNATGVEREVIPPVPPVPKHHSFHNKIGSLQTLHSRDSSFSTVRDATIDDAAMHSPKHTHSNPSSTDGSVDEEVSTGFSHRQSINTKQKPLITIEDMIQCANDVNTHTEVENVQATIVSAASSPAEHGKHMEDEAISLQKVVPITLTVTNKPTGKVFAARKRGKTLPGNLAAPPPVPSLPLPPMKLEPMKLDLRAHSNRKDMPRSPSTLTIATTPTRIPVPVFRYGMSKGSNSDIDLNSSSLITSSEDESSPLALMFPHHNGKSKSDRRRSTSKGSRTAPSSPRLPETPTTTSKSSSYGRIYGANRQDDDTNLAIKSPSSVAFRKTNASSQAADQVQRRISRSGANSLGHYGSRRHSVASISSMDTNAPDIKKPVFTSNAMDESILRRRHERNRRLSLHERLQNLVAEHRIKEDDEETAKQWDPKLTNEIAKIESHDHAAVVPRTSKKAVTRPHTVYEEYHHRSSPSDQRQSATVETRKSRSPLDDYMARLCPYERQEVANYGTVYYASPKESKHYAVLDKPEFNYGYDDERGDYNIIMHDQLCYRYEILGVLGKGSFGQVLKCLDHKTGESVAIKIIRNKKRFHAQALVEVKILQDLIAWDPEDRYNNVRMTDHFYFRNHLCIAFECLSMNLYEFIKSNNFRGFSLALIKRFSVQILNSLSLLNRHNVIHCDLKPENILLKYPNRSTIKIIDFGSSCLQSEKVYTYIQSRFYRSPEVILGMTYSMTIDMWSLGCILAELYTGYPLFPGENEQEQLACIMEVQGVPEPYLVEKSTRRKLFFDSYGNPRIVPNSRGKKRKPSCKSLAQVLRCSDSLFVDFVSRCLDWDPEKRMTPDEGMYHEWILESSPKAAPAKPSLPSRYSEETLTPPSSAAKLY